ncbi:MAG: hypothetical protein WBM87_05830 [Woeseiaceae bacterium]
MPVPNRSQLADLRGITRMTIDAAESIAEVVETMHHTIQSRPGPLGIASTGRPRGITGFVYRCVRGGIRLGGRAVDAGLAGVTPLLPEGESSPALDAYRSAVNGVYGDYLLRTENPLAIDMSLRYRGHRVDPHDPMRVIEQQGDVTSASKLVVLVHGLCMNDRQWHRNGHDHGAALADEQGYLPLYLHYNSGLHIASNGRLLAEMLETLIGNWSARLDELVIIGHSMGGLVARSACEYARGAGHTWLTELRKLVFLGTPHHGAPLERGGHGLDLVMQMSPYSIPFTRLSKARSAGITDLRHGAIGQGDAVVPLPAGVKCYAAAAVRAAKRSLLSERMIGDGLVPLDSALGRHRVGSRTLKVPANRQWVGYGMNHLELLGRAEVYGQLSSWLRESD